MTVEHYTLQVMRVNCTIVSSPITSPEMTVVQSTGKVITVLFTISHVTITGL